VCPQQNPQKIFEIVNVENISANLEDHYGTTDPIKVTEQMYAELKAAIRNGTWSIGRMAFFGGAYAAMEGFFALLPPMGLFLVSGGIKEEVAPPCDI
jgi:hypothetical protein